MKNTELNIEQIVNAIDFNTPQKFIHKKQKTSINKLKYLMMFILIFTICLIGCQDNTVVKTIVPPNPSNSLSDIQKELVGIQKNYAETTDTIKKNATDGESATPTAIKPILFPYWTNILNSCVTQDSLNKELVANQAKVTDLTTQVNDLKKFAKDQADRAEKEKQLRLDSERKESEQLRKTYTWISVACFVGMIVCISLAFSGSKIAVGVAVTCGIGLVTALTIAQTAWFIPYIVGGVVLIAGATACYEFFIKNRGIGELVHTTEAVKSFVSPEDRKKLFGFHAVPGTIFNIQSKATEALVSRFRQKLGKKAADIE